MCNDRFLMKSKFISESTILNIHHPRGYKIVDLFINLYACVYCNNRFTCSSIGRVFLPRSIDLSVRRLVDKHFQGWTGLLEIRKIFPFFHYLKQLFDSNSLNQTKIMYLMFKQRYARVCSKKMLKLHKFCLYARFSYVNAETSSN